MMVPLISGQPSGIKGRVVGTDDEVDKEIEERLSEGEGVTDTMDEEDMLYDTTGVTIGKSDEVVKDVTGGIVKLNDDMGLALGISVEEMLRDGSIEELENGTGIALGKV